MTTSQHRDPSTRELLALIEQQRLWMQQQQSAMERQQSAMERLQVEMARHTPTLPIAPIASRPAQSIERRRGENHTSLSLHRTSGFLRRPFGGRVTRLGVGMSLALLLLVAPGGSAVTHAAYEGYSNTAYGLNALSNPGPYSSFNAAFGRSALYSNDTGDSDTASGFNALYYNTSGSNNTASGVNALYANTTGTNNTASGTGDLYANTTGNNNTASGLDALYYNSTGTNNTAVGFKAGQTDTGANANTTGSNNTFIGYNSGPGTSSEITNATAIGANALVSQSNSIVLGGTGANTQHVGVGTTTPHSALQIAKGFLQIRPITGSEPAAAQCATADDAGRLVVRTDGNINLYICTGTGGWIGK